MAPDRFDRWLSAKGQGRAHSIQFRHGALCHLVHGALEISCMHDML
ncbi:MAG: hypothetical protein ACJASV_002824 [Pseudorhodobacter sp.]